MSDLNIIAGTTVENKGKLILTEIFPSVQKHDTFNLVVRGNQIYARVKSNNSLKTKMFMEIFIPAFQTLLEYYMSMQEWYITKVSIK
jgi:hypothetical protein